MELSLNTSVSITTSQTFHFVNRNEVEVTIDSVLQSRSCYGKLESLALSLLSEKTMDNTTRE